MEALLEYRQTDVCYGGVRAVRGVSFTLHAGEILGVVGESGCGKSTLLRAAMGLLGPGGLVTGGKILYRGENLPDLSHRARRRLNGPELGMIFQSAGSAFCPVRRVGDQLYEMMRAHGPMDKRAFRQQAGALLDRLGLEDGPRILNSYPFELSGGMQQRVGIAAAMLLRPRVLLADEPTAALDVSAQKQVLEELLLAGELRNGRGAGVPQSGAGGRHGRPGAGDAPRRDRGGRRDPAGAAAAPGGLYPAAAGGRAEAEEGVKWNRSCLFGS